jgi:hypothetical protein
MREIKNDNRGKKRKEKKERRRRKKLDTEGAHGEAKAGEVVDANVNANVSRCMTDSIPVPA